VDKQKARNVKRRGLSRFSQSAKSYLAGVGVGLAVELELLLCLWCLLLLGEAVSEAVGLGFGGLVSAAKVTAVRPKTAVNRRAMCFILILLA
jgi:hypothetical protein